MKKIHLLIIFLATGILSFAQQNDPGIITGDVLDENKKALEGVTVLLISLKDTTNTRATTTDKNGNFLIEKISMGTTVSGFPMSVSKHSRWTVFIFGWRDLIST